MFEQFTEPAINSIEFAHEEAYFLGLDLIDTEHVLLGLVSEDEERIGLLLGDQKILAAAVQALVLDRAQRKRTQTNQTKRFEEVVFNKEVNEILKLAAKTAVGLEHVGTEHLLISLITHGESKPLFKELGLSTNDLPHEIESRLSVISKANTKKSAIDKINVIERRIATWTRRVEQCRQLGLLELEQETNKIKSTWESEFSKRNKG
ncbi:MAG: hypothetical protein EKK48_10415 [Candidatus Melainabacteria bacterium]|nr:MAG: hypothetical protein EKK48_10415 [Candidatus Melainabacteria bacterium]